MTNTRNPALVALGQQIRKVRTARGISQEDFAAEAGLGRSYYGGVERGERNISALNLMRVAVTLKVEVGELFPKEQTFRELLDRYPEATADSD
jgi:transcriptional regulator with XRE-family HTH domain